MFVSSNRTQRQSLTKCVPVRRAAPPGWGLGRLRDQASPASRLFVFLHELAVQRTYLCLGHPHPLTFPGQGNKPRSPLCCLHKASSLPAAEADPNEQETGRPWLSRPAPGLGNRKPGTADSGGCVGNEAWSGGGQQGAGEAKSLPQGPGFHTGAGVVGSGVWA